jgi:hypothetical protein
MQAEDSVNATLSLSCEDRDMRYGLVFAAILLAILDVAATEAKALDLSDDLTITGYVDARLVGVASEASWLRGGLGKFRYGNNQFAGGEAVLQASWQIDEALSAVSVLRAEPQTPTVLDALETYLRYAPVSERNISWSVKAGAFFPTISLENDDLGWASPYTLTPSAINSWIGDEIRTIGSEATLRWDGGSLGTISLMGALICCNDEAGELIADRGWAMNDRPFGLTERERVPDATLRIFQAPVPGTTGMFDEIDGIVGWYAGAIWQIPGIAKFTVTRYDNQADPAAATLRDAGWRTKFWNFGARTQFGPLVLIAQQMSGWTEIVGPGFKADTKFQSGFLLASYDLQDWRVSLREDLFQTRRLGAVNNLWNEDGYATTASISWSPEDWLRLTGEIIAMNSRRGEYLTAGSPLNRNDTQAQFSTRFFF